MNRVRFGVVALVTALISVWGCGSSGDTSSTTATTSTSTTTTGTEEPSDIPPLPSPLPPVTDPGTIDPVLGDFPVDADRSVQYEWVSLASKGRDFTTALRAKDPFFKDYHEEYLYMDGVIVCVDLRQNVAVSAVIEDRGLTYQSEETPLTEEAVGQIGAKIAATAVEVLCPDMEVLFDDPELQTATPVVLRSILGVDEGDLSDGAANKFANFVCQELNRGTTMSRLVSDIADEFDYPDDLSEGLVDYIAESVC